MTSDTPTPDQTDDEQEPSRRIGFWLTALDRMMRREFARAFDELGITRRDWRVLNLIAGTEIDQHLSRKVDAWPGLVAPLVERGWVTGEPGDWQVTDEGRSALESMEERVRGIRSKIAESVSPEEYATTLASLEAMARALGWSEQGDADDERGDDRREWWSRRKGWGRRRGFGRGAGGFGSGWGGFGPGSGFGPHFGHGAAAGFGTHFGHGRHPGSSPHHGYGSHHGRDDVHVHIHVHGDKRAKRADRADRADRAI